MVLTVAALACAGAAIAQNPAAAGAVKVRQQGLKHLGAAFKVIRDELRGASPDVVKLRSAVPDITQAAAAMGNWFPVGSGPQPGVKTDALPGIWTDAAGFAAAREAFVREATRWAQLRDEADASVWKEAAASLGQSCKGCHDKYREKRD
jgi:cytochrome c556